MRGKDIYFREYVCYFCVNFVFIGQVTVERAFVRVFVRGDLWGLVRVGCTGVVQDVAARAAACGGRCPQAV